MKIDYRSTEQEIQEALHAKARELFSFNESDDPIFTKAPGRVNLIGEHTDYNNCPVLPCAVDRAIYGLIIPRDDSVIRIADLNPQFEPIEFDFSSGEVAPYPTGHWGNYCKAAVDRLLRYTSEISHPTHVLQLKDDPDGYQWMHNGYSMVFFSTIPEAAGMSSSSALVVLNAASFLLANGISWQTPEQGMLLADICSKAEWFVGTQGGGMDQTAIIHGKDGHAVKIDFNPLAVAHVPVPDDIRIVVAHSTVEAPKTQHVMDKYNRRAIECRLAAAIIGTHLKEQYQVEGIQYIGDLTQAKVGKERAWIDHEANTLLHPQPYTLEEIADKLGMRLEEVQTRYCLRKDGTIFPVPEEGFELYKRFHHIWTEWERVEQAAKLLKDKDTAAVGRLMNQSHESCRDYHEISCTELDTLTDIAGEHGSLGSRLTGAGFGGCTVHFVRESNLEGFIQGLSKDYYQDYLGLDHETARHHMFIIQPSNGLSILN